jgi:hypothetical protein
MIRYIFSDAPLTILGANKANPQRIGEALKAVTDQAKGKLTPKAVVEAARNNKSPLHKHFEWDDAKAAESYRLEQARELIRIIRVEEESGPVRAFFSIADRGTSYRALEEVRATPSLQEIVMKQALRDLKAFEERYRDMRDVCEDIRAAQRKISTKLTAANEQRVAA